MAKCEHAVEKLLSLADGLYDEGYQGLKYLPNGARTAIRLAGKVYQEIGNEIRRQNFSVMNRPNFRATQTETNFDGEMCDRRVEFSNLTNTRKSAETAIFFN